MINYISSRGFIGRLLSDCSLEGTAYLSNVQQWIEDGIEIMEIPKYYITKSQRKEVNTTRVLLPCDIQYLLAVLTDYNCTVNENYEVQEYIQGLNRLIIRNNPMLGAGVILPSLGNNYGYLNGNYINTSFEKGHVLFVYKGIPCDKEGFPMVPKDAKVNEALRYWIIYNLGIMGIEHPVVKWSDALQLWEKNYPKARNSVNWMDAQEQQEFTEMWNTILLGDKSNSLEL